MLTLPPTHKTCALQLWSDPEDIDGWGLSPRGAGYLFGASVCEQFTQLNKIDLIARAHQVCVGGEGCMRACVHVCECASVRVRLRARVHVCVVCVCEQGTQLAEGDLVV